MTTSRCDEGVSVVVPAFRSPGTLEQLCTELQVHVAPLFTSMELILVDDGSGDETWAEIERLSSVYDWVRGITLLRNYGQHNALLAGLRTATRPTILTIDDDLQNPPSQVHLLLERLTPDVDLVYGRPIEEPQGRLRNLASTLAKRAMATSLGPDVYPNSSAFRLFRRDLVAAGDSVRDPSISVDVLLSWATNRIDSVRVEFAPREDGQSGYDVRKLARHGLNMVTGYSSRPLHWMSFMGLAFALFGFGMLMFVVGRYFLGDADVAGFTFVAAAITLFAGVQLVSLGVLGEYVGRMHFRSMGKPPYVIRGTTEPEIGQIDTPARPSENAPPSP